MEQKKRKISVRKIIQLLVTVVVTTGCVIAILSASKVQNKRTVRGMEVHILNRNSCAFIHEEQVKDILIGSRHISLEQTPVMQLNIRSMEAIMRSNPWIETAEVYVDNAGILHVFARQRVPVFRVFERNGNSYYVDASLKTVPLSGRYTHYAPVVTNVPELKDDSSGNDLRARMMKIVQTISADTFWSVQVAEIRLAEDHSFELVPVLGAHRIIIGDTSRLEEKLSYVFNFYKQVLNRVGWNKYQVINASYRGQIVASPSLPWKPPKDKAMSNMNWVKSIMGNAPPDNSANAIAATPAATTASAAAPAKQPETASRNARPDQPAKPADRQPAAQQPATPPAKQGAATPQHKVPVAAAAKQAPQPAPQTGKKADTPEPAAKQKEKEPPEPKYIYQGNSN